MPKETSFDLNSYKPTIYEFPDNVALNKNLTQALLMIKLKILAGKGENTKHSKQQANSIILKIVTHCVFFPVFSQIIEMICNVF